MTVGVFFVLLCLFSYEFGAVTPLMLYQFKLFKGETDPASTDNCAKPDDLKKFCNSAAIHNGFSTSPIQFAAGFPKCQKIDLVLVPGESASTSVLICTPKTITGHYGFSIGRGQTPKGAANYDVYDDGGLKGKLLGEINGVF